MQNPHDHKKFQRAAIILASGDGYHRYTSAEFTTRQSVPQRFWTITGHENPLEETIHSVARLVPLQSAAIVVNRAHREVCDRMVGVPSSSIVAQPASRGSIPEILYGLRRLARFGRNTIVAVFPCTHFFHMNDRLIRYVEEAMATVEASPSLSIVLGITPTSSESAFGWIEPGEPAYPTSVSIFRVSRFWRKPPADLAAKLSLEGWLWNSHIMIAPAPRLQEMIAECVPELYVAFNAAFASLNDDRDWMAVDSLYGDMGTYEFSEEVLSRCPRDLVVKRIDDVGRNNCIAEASPSEHVRNFLNQPTDAR